MPKEYYASILFALLSMLFLIGNVQGLDELNGWILPTGSGDLHKYVGFGAHYKPGGVPSIHLGQDFEGDAKDPVFALADGEVIESRTDVGGYGPVINNKATTGGAIIALFTTSDGLQFKSLYGHIDNPHPKGMIKAGDILGYINEYNPSHLHFGIHPGIDYPLNPWRGYITESEYARTKDTYGWVDPLEFLKMHSPIGSSPHRIMLTLYVHEGSKNGPIIPDAQVTGQDESGNSFQARTDSSGAVTIAGYPGTWSFTASASVYEPNSWSQPITVTCTKHAFLQKSVVSTTDNVPPTVNAFSVSPLSLMSGESFAISYTVAEDGGSGLKQVELWRKDETTDWREIDRESLTGNGPVSGSLGDSPSSAGTYWYGLHVVDNANNWNDERNSHTNNQPGIYGPVKVEAMRESGQDSCRRACDACFEEGLREGLYEVEHIPSDVTDITGYFNQLMVLEASEVPYLCEQCGNSDCFLSGVERGFWHRTGESGTQTGDSSSMFCRLCYQDGWTLGNNLGKNGWNFERSRADLEQSMPPGCRSRSDCYLRGFDDGFEEGARGNGESTSSDCSGSCKSCSDRGRIVGQYRGREGISITGPEYVPQECESCRECYIEAIRQGYLEVTGGTGHGTIPSQEPQLGCHEDPITSQMICYDDASVFSNEQTSQTLDNVPETLRSKLFEFG